MKGIDRVRERIAQIEERYRQIVSGRGRRAFDDALEDARTAQLRQARSDLTALTGEISGRYGVDADLVEAIVSAESGWNPDAVSAAGAQGLMQLMPGTATAFGISDAFDPAQNLDAGVRHLRGLVDRYPGSLESALAAYNAGTGAVDRYGGVPPYPETRRFVEKVLAAYTQGKRG
jgi:soluble lytic murein transglycosylase-like protein